MSMTHSGRCHCGAVSVAFESAKAPEDFAVRACQCSFCRMHGARTIADAAGRLTVTLQDEDAVNRYRFDARTADFLVCRTCGAYVCAVIEEGGRSYATLNINVLDDRAAFAAEDAPVSYDGEATSARIARRVAAWTPAEIVVAEA